MSKNPKLEGTNIVDCIPQTGYCPNKCRSCFYNNGFYRTLDEPLIPTMEEAEGKIVRVNSGHDSNIQRDLVIKTTQDYKDKFYNTSIPYFYLPGPVVFTINPRENEGINIAGSTRYLDNPNVMAIRYRLTTMEYNILSVKKLIRENKGRKPILLTFMRYRSYEDIPVTSDYEFKKHIINSYWSIKEEAWNRVVANIMLGEYASNAVRICGKEFGNSMCKNCGNCESLYNLHKERN